MSFDLDTLCSHHAWSGEQTGKPAKEAGVPDEEPTVGIKLGNSAGEFCFYLQGLVATGRCHDLTISDTLGFSSL